MYTKITVRCYFKSKTMAKKKKKKNSATIHQLKLLHTAVENINYTTSWKNNLVLSVKMLYITYNFNRIFNTSNNLKITALKSKVNYSIFIKRKL